MTTGDADHDRLPIGMFSRASGISVRTLRNYHDSGLLVPAVVDRWTGYRYYGLDQLADALVIVRLRGLDLPLARVHDVLERRDPEFTAAVLEGHRAVMEEKLRQTEEIVTALQSGISTATTPVHVQRVESTLALTTTADVAGPDMWAWLEHAVDQLQTVAGERAVVGAVPGALYGPSLDDEDHEVITAFVPIDATFLVPPGAHPMVIDDLPRCDVAVLAHPGGFDGIGDTYRLLGAWVARNAAAHPHLPVRELYHALARDAREPDTIEIQWPLPGDPVAGVPSTPDPGGRG